MRFNRMRIRRVSTVEVSCIRLETQYGSSIFDGRKRNNLSLGHSGVIKNWNYVSGQLDNMWRIESKLGA